MKPLIIWVTDKGKILGKKLKEALGGEVTFYHKEKIKKAFLAGQPLIFISACGIAVRTVAPWIRHKSIDPPVAVVDEEGRFAISLLSGHLGGANLLVERISESILAIPVITTASDLRHLPALDLWLKECGVILEDWKTLTSLQSKLLKEKQLKIFLEPPLKIPLPKILQIAPKEDADLIITYQHQPYPKPSFVIRSLVVGLGFHQEEDKLEEKIKKVLLNFSLSPKAISLLATIERRKKVRKLQRLAQNLGAELIFFDEEEIKKVSPPSHSLAQKFLKIPGVAEPCALLASGGGPLVLKKTVFEGITLAVALKKDLA